MRSAIGPRGEAAAYREVSVFKSSFRAVLFVLFGSLALYGATAIPASAFQTGKDMVTVALILTVNSLS
jgi:predicted small integral membrane protein